MRERQIVICLGRAGTGKTRKLSRCVVERLGELQSAGIASLVLIHDERCRVAGGWDTNAIGCLAPERARYKSPADMLAAVADDGKYASWMNTFYECDPLALFVIAENRRRAGRATIVVMDELDRLPAQLRRDRPGERDAYACAHYGRCAPVDILATCRQPQRIDSSWFALADVVHAFALTGDLQLQRIKQSGWGDADHLVAALPALKPFQYITIEPGG